MTHRQGSEWLLAGKLRLEPQSEQEFFYRIHRIFLDFFHRPVFPKKHDVSETGSVSVLTCRVFWNTGRWKKSRNIL
jgi:hypothetical protein